MLLKKNKIKKMVNNVKSGVYTMYKCFTCGFEKYITHADGSPMPVIQQCYRCNSLNFINTESGFYNKKILMYVIHIRKNENLYIPIQKRKYEKLQLDVKIENDTILRKHCGVKV